MVGVNIIKADLGGSIMDFINFENDIKPIRDRAGSDNQFNHYIFVHRDWFTRSFYEDANRKTYDRDFFLEWEDKEKLGKQWREGIEKRFQDRDYKLKNSLFIVDSHVFDEFTSMLGRYKLEPMILEMKR